MNSSIDASKLTDRELLLLLHERQSVMGGDVRELKDGTTTQLASLQIEVSNLKDKKAEKITVERLERGQQRLFNYLWGGFGALAVLQIAMQIVIPLLWKFYIK